MALWSSVLASLSAVPRFLREWFRLATWGTSRWTKIIKVIVGLLIALGFIIKTESLRIILMVAGLGFERDLSINSALSIGVLAIWLLLTCGVAWARTDWQPMIIGEPEWDAATFQYHVEIRKPGELAKRLVWIEIEEIRFEDGTRYDAINLPLILRWIQDYSRHPNLITRERLIGRNKISFLQFAPADTRKRYSAIRLIGAEQVPSISDERLWHTRTVSFS